VQKDLRLFRTVYQESYTRVAPLEKNDTLPLLD